MAGDNKTEKPTPKKIEDARKKGQVAKSNDLNGAATLITATLILGLMGPSIYKQLAGMTKHAFSNMLVKAVTPDGFITLVTSTVESIALLILPILAGVMVMAILVNLFQIKPMISPEAIKPKLDKLNPVNGFKRLWSMRSLVETGKAILKMGIVGLCGVGVIWARHESLLGLSHAELVVGVQTIVSTIGEIAVYAGVVFLVLGMADFFYQKYELEKQLRMTKQEVKDERKNMDGDPQIKRKIREAGMQMTRKRQLESVKTADVVINNPTHISIAIKYDPDVSPAPIVVAKGQEHFAFKIREVAREHNIPMVENKPVARALWAVSEVDQIIPPEMFVAVAEILALVFSRQKGRRPRRQTVR